MRTSPSPTRPKTFWTVSSACSRRMPALLKAVAALNRRFELAEAVVARPAVALRRGLRVGNFNLLVAHDSGGELLDAPRLYPLPLAPPWCRGLLNLRGQLVPAFDLHQYLGVASLRTRGQWWLVLGRAGDALAICVDALPQSLSVEHPLPAQALVPDALRTYVACGYRIADELWLEFDYRKFFAGLRLAAA
jgi:twitching motility protein PilI